jgi:hypothetical protein
MFGFCSDRRRGAPGLNGWKHEPPAARQRLRRRFIESRAVERGEFAHVMEALRAGAGGNRQAAALRSRARVVHSFFSRMY